MTAISPRAQRGGWCEPADLPKGPNGRALCRRCATEVPQGRRTFCSSDCVHEWKLRTNPAYVRQKTWERDGGVCSACGTDTMAALRQRQGQRWRGHWRGTGHLWQADHIVAVAEGGGLCGLDNIRTLCTPCHREHTTALVRRLRRKEDAMEPRDPRIDPRPGDVFRKGEEAVMVHFVKNDTVYLGEYDDETQSSSLGGARMALDAFRRAAQEAETVEAIDD